MTTDWSASLRWRALTKFPLATSFSAEKGSTLRKQRFWWWVLQTESNCTKSKCRGKKSYLCIPSKQVLPWTCLPTGTGYPTWQSRRGPSCSSITSIDLLRSSPTLTEEVFQRSPSSASSPRTGPRARSSWSFTEELCAPSSTRWPESCLWVRMLRIRKWTSLTSLWVRRARKCMWLPLISLRVFTESGLIKLPNIPRKTLKSQHKKTFWWKSIRKLKGSASTS